MASTLTSLFIGACGILLAGAASAAEPPPGGSAWVRWPEQTRNLQPGARQYEYYCSSCHAAGPEKRPGTEALRAKYNGEKPPLLSERTDLTPEMVKLIVRNGVSIMPFFRKTEVSDADLNAIAAYLSRTTNR